jgi:menaquinone-dependent protoporphyrinogen oxidase
MRVLVAYGSKMGGTKGIAEILGEALESRGLDVQVESVTTATKDSVEASDAVVVGGALYAFRWYRPARKFVKRNKAALAGKPVWFFSSGPLDDSASEKEIPPVRQAQKLMDLVGARGHMTFGGRLPADAKGFPASAMAKKQAGDWRDPAQIRTWAEKIAADLA